MDEVVECLDWRRNENECAGEVEFRMPLSGTGRSFPRCDKHWKARLVRQAEIEARYPQHAPSDWSPLDAGESWEEDE